MHMIEAGVIKYQRVGHKPARRAIVATRKCSVGCQVREFLIVILSSCHVCVESYQVTYDKILPMITASCTVERNTNTTVETDGH